MRTPEERAQIARQNGAKSKGPKTQAGKDQSRRNAIKHGERAETLKLFVPPHSAVLIHEQRREFYKLFDTNVAKFAPADETELNLVREITDLQWANCRNRITACAILNRALLQTAPAVTPILPETFELENTVAAYESLAGSAAIRQLHREYTANMRLIAATLRVLDHVQRRWPARSAALADAAEDRAGYHVPPAERTQPDTVQATENTQPDPERPIKEINVKAPLTPEKVRLYKSIYPNRELQFNVYGPDTEPETATPAQEDPPKAA